MKKKVVVEDTIVSVVLKAENGEEFALKYDVTSIQFINVLELFSKFEKNSKKNTKTEAQKAQDFLKIFTAVKRLVGEDKYEEILDFCEENEEEFSLTDFIQIVGIGEVEEDLPKE